MLANNIAILSIGREILLGHTVDTNASHMCRDAGDLGYRFTRILAVDDAQGEIVAALRELAADNRFILVTGGLGPTPDDLTRAAVAEFAGVDLVYHEDLWRTVQERFKSFHKEPTESNKVQAYQPRGAKVINNPLGTAPGIDLEVGNVRVFVMPGVPLEMKRMFAGHVLPVLRENARQVRYMKRFQTCGLGESRIGEIIRDCEKLSPEADIGTAVDNMVCTVRIMGYGADLAAAESKAAAARDALRERLSDYIFAEDGQNIAETVLQALVRRGKTVALAESCTAGKVAAALVDYDGASAVLKEGVVCYSNEAKMRLCGVPGEILEKHGAVSEECVRALAENVRKNARADYGVSISGIAGPSGGTPEKPVGTVWIAVSAPDGGGVKTTAQCFHFLADRNGNRERAKNAALKMLLQAAIAQ